MASDGETEATHQVDIGTQIMGTFEINQHIATGGMGEVYRGTNIHTQEPVAIKIVLAALAHDEKILSLFQKEATVLGRLHHEAIVRYMLFTVDPAIKRACLVMEFVEGRSLSDFMDDGPLSLDDAKILLRRLASGLQKAHELGVVHRDLSPDNIIVQDGTITHAKIIDFGIAKSENFGGGTLLGGQFAGKYNYVSPEQLGRFQGVVKGQSDIYSLALVVAGACRGAPIDMGDSPADAVEKRLGVPDVSFVPEEIRQLITMMLQPDPSDRPESMAQVIEYLDDPSRLPGLPEEPVAPPSGSADKTVIAPQPVNEGPQPVVQTMPPDSGFAAMPSSPGIQAPAGFAGSAPPQSMPPGTAPPQSMPPGTAPPQSMPPQGMPPGTAPPQSMPPQSIPPAGGESDSPFGAPAAPSAPPQVSQPQVSAPPQPAPSPAPEPKKRSLAIPLVLGLAVVGGGGYFAYTAGLFGPQNTPPVATADTFAGEEDLPVRIPTAALLANDTDVDPDDVLVVTEVSGAENGTVALESDTVTFTPDRNFDGEAGFSYTITDGAEESFASAAVTITIAANNAAPTPADDSRTVDFETVEEFPLNLLLSNDQDPDGDEVRFVTFGAVPDQLTIEQPDAETVRITPAPGFSGELRVPYEVTDGRLNGSAVLRVIVLPDPNLPPDLGRLAEMAEWVDDYPLPTCNFATVSSATPENFTIEAYGPDPDPFVRLDRDFLETHRMEASIGLRQVNDSQCPVVNFIRTVRDGEAVAPRLTLDKDVLKPGEAIRGEVDQIDGRTIWLLLVDNQGGTYDLSSRLQMREDGTGRFGLALRPNMQGSAGDLVPQMILAVATENVLQAKEVPPGTPAELLMRFVIDEIDTKGEDAAAGVGYFRFDLE